MDFVKAIGIGAVVSICVAMVVGSQGSSGGPLAIDAVKISDVRLYWSWPLFFAGTGLFWGLSLLQR